MRRATVAAAAAGALVLSLAVAGGVQRGPSAPEEPQPSPAAQPVAREVTEPPPAPGATVDPSPARALPALSPTAPVPDEAVLVATLAPLLTAPALGPSVGAVVVDAMTGTVLYDADGDTARVPASTVKVLTAAAALHRLGPESVATTSVVAGQGPDEVVLVGGGDALLAPGAGDPFATTGHAGLEDLATQVAAARQARGATAPVTLVLDETLTGGGPQVSPSWGTADVASGYVAPLTSLAIDVGRLRPEAYAWREADPSMAAAQVLATRLAEQGVPVAGPPVRGVAPAGTDVLASVSSAPLREVVAQTLADSDNTLADLLALRVAADAGITATDASIFAAAGDEVLAAVAETGVDVSGATMVGGSGLGRGSAVPPAVLAGVLARASAPDAPEGLRPLLAALPVAGLDGTLAGRFRGPLPVPAAGLVRAKSGTLSGVSSLAGTLVDADGRPLVFAVVADQVPGSGTAPGEVDAVVAALAACGCR